MWFYELNKELVREFMGGCWLAGAMLVILSGLYLFILVIILVSVDYCFGSSDLQRVESVGKDFTPAHCITSMVMSGKTMIPVTTCYEDSWNLFMSNGVSTFSCNAHELQYNAYVSGREYQVEVTQGFLTSSIYCERIQKEY
jgi:hypothetical protein